MYPLGWWSLGSRSSSCRELSVDSEGLSGGTSVGFSVGVGGVIIGCTKRSCVPGITNSGISFRISDLLRNILLPFERRSVVGVGVECFRYGCSVGTFFRFHARLATNETTMMIIPKARPSKAVTRAVELIVLSIRLSFCAPATETESL